MITIKTSQEINTMREGGKITAAILDSLKQEIRPGISTAYFNQLAQKLIKKYNATFSFYGYKPTPKSNPFPAAVCASVNDEIVHGIPGKRVLKNGDVLSLDLGVKHKGFHTDSAITVGVGNISEKATNLLEVTKRVLEIGIEEAYAGNRLGDLGYAIQEYVESKGYNVVMDLAGHGIGRSLHEEPHVLNYGRPRTGLEFREGMTIAIEPMVAEGDCHILRGRDGFVFRTADGKLSAHFEHTVAITKNGVEILTRL